MNKKPSIFIMTDKIEESCIKEILAGIEEEGVPFEVEVLKHIPSQQLAQQGAEKSSLEIGIGIGNGQICVALRNSILKKADAKSSAEELRKLGANAARYVKGIPFKI